MAALAKEYITYARQFSLSGCFAKAINLYLKAFEKNVLLKPLCEPEFRSNIMKLSEMLAAANKFEDIFSNLERALTVYPNNVYLMNEIGKYLYKYGYYEEAWNQFEKALELDVAYVRAEKSLNSMKNLMVERWHFRMLNDKTRNDGYRAALHECIEPRKSTVLDIGTGSGVLSMYATESNPLHIVACEGSNVMVTLAGSVTLDNELLMPISIVNKMSTSLTKSDIEMQLSLVVTELFDAGLFGEHILQSLSHAWQNLLERSAKVIPHSAEFYVLGVHSNMLNAKYQLQQNPKLDLNIPEHKVHVLLCDETYDCEDVHLYQDIKYMTEAAKVVRVNFTNPRDIQDKLKRKKPYNVKLKALESGEINALIGWFNLNLTANITITTDPRNKNKANAWQQALFFDFLPRELVEKEILNTKFYMNTGKIRLQSERAKDIMRISPESVRFLNDTDYLKMIKSCTGMAYVYLEQLAEISDVKVVDLCPFPVFGFLMLKRGIDSLICYAKTRYDKQFLEEVFKENDIDLSRLTVLVGEEWTQEYFGEEKYHAIFCNILELCGDIDVRCKNIADNLKNSHLIHGGLFMPSSVTLVAQVVSSAWLEINNRVFDDNVYYKISKHMKKYEVTQNFCVDFNNLEYTPMSDPVVLGNCNNLMSNIVNVPITNDGDANAILCWYNIELLDSMAEISTKRPYSFIEGTVFLFTPIQPLAKGTVPNIYCCVDSDGCYKLRMGWDFS